MQVKFDWDEGNNTKSYSKHGASIQESESMFQDVFRIDFSDPFHSTNEFRYVSIGQSSRPRLLFAAWTLRDRLVRVISIRPASLKERKIYEKNKA